MLAIRLQRTGRKGHAQFRVIVQDARRTPTSGKVVEKLGHFNPHSSELVIDKDKAKTYLSNGAQPSDKIARLFVKEGIKLPDWVNLSEDKQRTIRNQDKLRKNRPAEPEAKVEESEVKKDEPKQAEVTEEAKAPTEEETTENAEEPEVSDEPEQQEESPKVASEPEKSEPKAEEKA